MEVKQGFKQTEIGPVPNDWEFIKLDTYTKRGSGHTPSKRYSAYYNGDIVWVSLADSDILDNGLISDSSIKISKLGLQNSSAVMHPKGTVIMSRDAGIGKSGVAGCELCVSQHFIAWKCDEKNLHNWFLYYWLQFKKSEFERIAIGSTIKTIGLPYFENYKVPLPKFREQTAIATALSDTDALISGLEKLIEKKRAIKQGAMQQLLTPKEDWEVKRLGEECELITKGTTPTSVGKDFQSSGINFIKIESLTENGKIVKDKVAFIDIDTNNLLKRSQIKQGDALFSIAGALGRVALVNDEILPANTNQALAIIRLRKDSEIDLKYLYFYLKSKKIQTHILSISVQGAQANLSLLNISDLKIEYPLKTEQIEIGETLTDMDAEITGLETKLEKYRKVKQGMMQELLTGKIRLV